MTGLNRATLIGHLGKDPELRRTNSGNPVVSFSLATSESWRDKQTGERREKTEWHNIVIFNEHLAKIAEQYLKKGSKVYLEGKLQTRKWQDQSGADRWTTEIVLAAFGGQILLLDRKGDDGGGAAATSSAYAPARGPTVDTTKTLAEDLNDEIPF